MKTAITRIMLIEHDMDAVFALADHLTVMVNGQVIASGTPAEIRADASVQAAYLVRGTCMTTPAADQTGQSDIDWPENSLKEHFSRIKKASCPINTGVSSYYFDSIFVLQNSAHLHAPHEEQ